MARLARELKVHLVAGSITEHISGQEKTYNTSVMLGPDGSRMGVYRKIHLFDIDLPGTRDGNRISLAARGLRGRVRRLIDRRSRDEHLL